MSCVMVTRWPSGVTTRGRSAEMLREGLPLRDRECASVLVLMVSGVSESLASECGVSGCVLLRLEPNTIDGSDPASLPFRELTCDCRLDL